MIYIFRANYFLIQTTDKAGKLFEMHQLVQLSTRRWLESYGELERWKKKYVINMSEAFPNGEYENWTTCQALFPHARMESALENPVLKHGAVLESFFGKRRVVFL